MRPLPASSAQNAPAADGHLEAGGAPFAESDEVAGLLRDARFHCSCTVARASRILRRARNVKDD